MLIIESAPQMPRFTQTGERSRCQLGRSFSDALWNARVAGEGGLGIVDYLGEAGRGGPGGRGRCLRNTFRRA